jgi:hypothetical protein
MRKNKPKPCPCVLTVGNAYDGTNLIGPFPSAAAALRYVDRWPPPDSWTIVLLHKPGG